MKTKIFYLATIIAVSTAVLSCQKFDSVPNFTKSKLTFTASASTTTIAVAAADSLSSALTLTWNDPKYAVGLASSKFTVTLGNAGANFVTFTSKSFTGTLTGSLLGKDLNGMALKLGGTIGTPIDLDLKVVASQANNDEPLTSNLIQINVTPYGDLSLSATSLNVVCSAATSGDNADTLTWTTAFVGYNGVKTYELQYAAGGTAFATPTVVSVTSFSQTFTQLDFNKLAIGLGIAGTGDVDFRVKASNESGATVYSNTVTVNITTYVANNSIGIIGDGTPGGWNTDTDMYRPDPVNHPGDWTVTVYLIGGNAAKFRADDDWAANWGANAFPTGTGLQNGANIPIANSGYYKVDFNAGSGVYTFTSLPGTTYTNISIIGSVVGTAWTTDFDLTQDGTNPHLWTGTIVYAAAGEVKLRANHDWGTNWGNTKFPSDFGAGGGPNIPVSSGTYFVRFDDVSGEYFFSETTNNDPNPFGRVGVIGDATANGWNDPDSPLIQNPSNPYKWSGKYTLTGPGKFAKFRADNAWATNWGAATFPNGAGSHNGPNIPVDAGTYQITFNSATGEYTFTN